MMVFGSFRERFFFSPTAAVLLAKISSPMIYSLSFSPSPLPLTGSYRWLPSEHGVVLFLFFSIGKMAVSFSFNRINLPPVILVPYR